jgi:hypothetical protein
MGSNSLQFMIRSAVIAITLLIAVIPTVARSQDASVPVAEAQAKPVKHSADWVEKRIAKLHANLHITAAQESVWTDVATAMRDNAKAMKTLIEQWAKQADKMTALESLRMHGEMAAEHAKGMQLLIPAFEKLYNMMSAEQKTIANMLFAHKKNRKHRMAK